jgi:C4-dicarboxylate-specific signal transduction histidine kinase
MYLKDYFLILIMGRDKYGVNIRRELAYSVSFHAIKKSQSILSRVSIWAGGGLMLLSSLSSFAQDCVITYGLYDDYEPYEWMENGKARGINIELLKSIVREAGCELNIVSHPWPQMIEMLRNGEITLLSASMTPKRMVDFQALQPTFIQYRVLVSRKGTVFINDLAQLNNNTVLTLTNSVAAESLAHANNEVRLISYPSEHAALKALSAGKGDFAIIDGTSNIMDDYQNLIVASKPIFPTLYGFILRKDSPYLSRLSQAASALWQTGEYYSIINKEKEYKYTNLRKVSMLVFLFFVSSIILVVLWNKSLRTHVKKKTHGLSEEIERRIRIEQALVAQKKECQDLASILQTILIRIPVLVFIVDKKCNTLWYSKKENKSFSPGCAVDHISGLAEEFTNLEFSLEDEQNRLWKVLAINFPYEGQNAVLLFVDDITENVRLRDELFMTSRFSALGEMASVVAHEINNPIGCILHNFDFLQRCIPEQASTEDAEDVKLAKEAVTNSLIRMKSMVDELRGYTIRQSKDYNQVDLAECIKSAVSITRFLIRKHTHNFLFDTALETLVFGNYGQIEQMIINILQNACYALTNKSQSISCSLEKTAGYAKVVLQDQGVGMDEQILKNACNPYFTTRQESGGTGLGLSLTSRLIKEHGGYMEIHSVPGQGTAVSLFFPVL